MRILKNGKMSRAFCFIMALAILQGCRSRVETAVQGTWVIEPESFIFKGTDISDCIGANVIFFFKNGNCTFPGFLPNCGPLSPDRGFESHWHVREDSAHTYALVLDAARGYFPKEMHIWFSKDVIGKWFIMHFESELLTFHCKKDIFDFDGNRNLIDKAIFLTTGDKPISH